MKEIKTTYHFSIRDYRAALARSGITQKELANKLNICETTLIRRIKDDGTFTTKEMGIMMDLFGKKETIDFLFSDEPLLESEN